MTVSQKPEIYFILHVCRYPLLHAPRIHAVFMLLRCSYVLSCGAHLTSNSCSNHIKHEFICLCSFRSYSRTKDDLVSLYSLQFPLCRLGSLHQSQWDGSTNQSTLFLSYSAGIEAYTHRPTHVIVDAVVLHCRGENPLEQRMTITITIRKNSEIIAIYVVVVAIWEATPSQHDQKHINATFIWFVSFHSSLLVLQPTQNRRRRRRRKDHHAKHGHPQREEWCDDPRNSRASNSVSSNITTLNSDGRKASFISN